MTGQHNTWTAALITFARLTKSTFQANSQRDMVSQWSGTSIPIRLPSPVEGQPGLLGRRRIVSMLVLWAPVLAKVIATALVVLLASVLAEVVGPLWGGLVASLPVSAGPAYVFLAMQHDGDFIAASALSSFAANAATGLFLIVYAKNARRTRSWFGLGCAMATWLLASLLIRQVVWTPVMAVLLNLAVYGMGFLMLAGPATTAHRVSTVTIRHWLDLPFRAAAIAFFVTGVVVASSLLGPEATGIAAVFPISLTSLIIILQPRIGRSASVLLAATALRAMLGFGLALLTLHLAIRPLGTTAALVVALLLSISWSGALLILEYCLRRCHATGNA